MAITKGSSVTIEVCGSMAEAESIAYAASEIIFTFGQTPVAQMEEVCCQIMEAKH